MKILAVDDAYDQLLIVRRQIERLGHECCMANGGGAALEAFKRERPDLVLMDVVMPEIDGYQATRAIRDAEQGKAWTPVIFLSGMTDETDLRAGIDAGGDDYLPKPVSPVVLAAKIKAMARLHDMGIELAQATQSLREANQVLTRLTTLDGLTGIANRRRFDEALRVEWLRAARDASAISLLMVDIDHFKAYNDHHGHVAGDQCLRLVANALHTALQRPADLVARYGGEEFAVLLPSTPAFGALKVGWQLCNKIRNLHLKHEFNALPAAVTISVGACTMVPDHSWDEQTLVAYADEQLYMAKRAGRDQVLTRETPELSFARAARGISGRDAPVNASTG